jgi:hypothetical protein
MPARELGDLGHNFFGVHFFAFRCPGSIFGIAPTTSKITARGPDENGRNTRQFAFALDGVENLRNKHRLSNLA